MEGRDRWQALQRHLGAARAAAERGDQKAALAEVGVALEIDPDFLAAQTLRDQLQTNWRLPFGRPAAPLSVSEPSVPAIARGAPPGVSPESYARFQQRAKERRVETRVAAARDGIRRRSVPDVAAALDELSELEPQLPVLAPLRDELEALRRRKTMSPRGPWLVAAATFAASILAASYLQEASSLASRPLVVSEAVVMPAAREASPLDVDALVVEEPSVDVVATSDIDGSAAAVVVPTIGPPPEPTEVADVSIATPAPRLAPAAEGVSMNLPAPVVALPPAELAVAPALNALTTPAPRPEPADDDSALVQTALQRYRSAYEGLDAESARAVWPAVNEAALARAFDGLESQRLTFDDCDVRVVGDSATATCRGFTRYVPKIGSREPRVEPRVWTFTFRKTASAWLIDSARADR